MNLHSVDSRLGRLEGIFDHLKEDVDRQEIVIGQLGHAASTMERVSETLAVVVEKIDKVSERLTTVEEKLRDETLIRTYRNNHIRNVLSAITVAFMLWSDKISDAWTQSVELIHRWLR